MDHEGKSLLLRADFTLGQAPAAGRLVYQRWRRVLAEGLPRLVGLRRRCPRAEVRLREGAPEGRYSAWLRIPVRRQLGRRIARRLAARVQSRLEEGLQPLGGRVLKVGIRRFGARRALLPLFADLQDHRRGAWNAA